MANPESDHPSSAPPPLPPAPPPSAPPPPKPRRARKRIILISVAALALLIGVIWYLTTLGKISTDDAYVNGHVTFVAPRVGGQVSRVLVDDNNRVRQGDLLVQLDPEPYQKQLDIAQAAVNSAQSDLVVAQAQARAMAAQARSARFNLERAIENVDNQIALLRAKVAALKSQQASLDNAKLEYDRILKLLAQNATTPKEVDNYKEAYLVAQARVEGALQDIYQVRVALGLPPTPPNSDDLAQVPDDLDQTHSSVRQAQAVLIQAAASLAIVDSFSKSPRQMISDFYKRDPEGNIDRIYDKILANAPDVVQSQAKLARAQRELDLAKLNLTYCNVTAVIDGVVTRRAVNPGNNVVPGQTLMAVRSLTEIWIDANFKETQLDRLRIGQPVDVEADMYGSRHTFHGRITGFTFGTGSTLALLPAENATGNFVKVVQRLPVRIDLDDYDPDQTPLFIGLSVTPTVHVNRPATGENAGAVLQPYIMPTATTPETPTTNPASTQPSTQPQP